MDELRLILIVIGAIIILLIYLWGTRKQIKARLAEKRRRRAARNAHNEPVLQDEQLIAQTETSPEWSDNESPSDLELDAPAADSAPRLDDAQSDLGPAAEQGGDDVLQGRQAPSKERIAGRRGHNVSGMNIVLTVMAANGGTFSGSDVRDACQDLDLTLNDKGIWDCHFDSQAQDGAVFGIAHLKEPGTFNLADLSTLSTPGLLFFAQFPGPAKATAAIDLMIATAGEIARKLGGILCDEKRKKISTQTMIRLRSEAAELDRRLEEL